MPLTVMSISPVEGWTDVEYKSFRADDASTSGSDTDEEEPVANSIKGFVRKQYKKIVCLEDLLPE